MLLLFSEYRRLNIIINIHIHKRYSTFRCWEPVWLNGTQIVFWKTDPNSRYENFPCQEELEQERLEEEAERTKILLKLENEKKEKEKQELAAAPPQESEPIEESSYNMYHLLIIVAIIAIVVLIISLIAFNKYKNYRPIYHVEKMSSPSHNEMKVLKGTIAEKTHLVS